MEQEFTLTNKEVLKIQMPESLDDIVLGKWIEVNSIQSMDIDVLDKNIKLISMICNVDEAKVELLNITDYTVVMSKLNTLFSNTMQTPPKFIYMIGNRTFRLKELNEYTTRQFIDFDTLLKGNSIDNMAMILAIMYEEEGEEYNKKTFTNKANLFKEFMPASVAVDAMVFCSALGNLYLTYIVDYLKEIFESNPKMKISKKMNKIIDWIDGVGNSL